MRLLCLLIALNFTLSFSSNLIPDYYQLPRNWIDYSLYRVDFGMLSGAQDSLDAYEPYRVSYNIPERKWKKFYLGYHTELRSDLVEQLSYLNSADITIHKERYSCLWGLNFNFGRSKENTSASFRQSLDTIKLENESTRKIIISDYYDYSFGGKLNILKHVDSTSKVIMSLQGDYIRYNGYNIREIACGYYYKDWYYDEDHPSNMHWVEYYNYKGRWKFNGLLAVGYWHFFSGENRRYQFLLNLNYANHYDQFDPEIKLDLRPYLSFSNYTLNKSILFHGIEKDVHTVTLSIKIGEINPEFVSLLNRYRFGWLKAKFAFNEFGGEILYDFGTDENYYMKLNDPDKDHFWTYDIIRERYNDLWINFKLGFRVYVFKKLFANVTLKHNNLLYSPFRGSYSTATGSGYGGVEFLIKDRIVLQSGIVIPEIGIKYSNETWFDFYFRPSEKGLFGKIEYLIKRNGK